MNQLATLRYLVTLANADAADAALINADQININDTGSYP